jgi:hypothetical protein
MGFAYDDDNYKAEDGITDHRILTETEDILNQINKRLMILRKSDLFNLVNKHTTQSISFRNTNVLINHKHYRYITTLWKKLHSDEIRPDKSEEKKIEFEQNVLKGLRAYGKSLITYTLKKNLEFELNGNYNNFSGQHFILSKVAFKETDGGTFQLEIGNYRIRIILVGNLPVMDEKLLLLLKSRNTFLFYYDEQTKVNNSRFIHLNPLDPDSIERVGTLIKKYLLLSYLDILTKAYDFKHLLKEYVQYIPQYFIEFKNYSYKFHSYPKTKLSLVEIRKCIESNSIFKSKSRPDQDNILKAISDLYDEIELNATRLKDEYLNCFNCGEKLHSYHIEKLNYFKCPSCQCLIDSSNIEKITLRIDDENYMTLGNDEFGMDGFTFNKVEL